MIGLGLGIHKSNNVLSALKLLTRNSDWAIWGDKATGTSKGTNSPQVNPIQDLVGVVGKNLFDSIIFGVQGVLDGRQYFECALDNQKTYDISFLQNQQYTINFESIRKSGGNSSARIDVFYTDATSETSLLGGSTAWASVTHTTQANKTVDRMVFRTAGAAVSGTSFVNINIQLELGTVATAYEPYGKANGLLQGFAFTTASGYVDVVAPNGKTVTGIQGDGTNDVILLPSNAPNPVGTQDFAFAFVFKTPSVLNFGFIHCRNTTDGTSVQIATYLINDGSLRVVVEGIYDTVIPSGTLQPNSWYKLIWKRVSGNLIVSLNSVPKYNSARANSITERPYSRLFARTNSADGSANSLFGNHILCYANYNNGDSIDAWEASQNKGILKAFGL